MSTTDTDERPSSRQSGERELDGQTVVVIGGTSGSELEAARLARVCGAEVAADVNAFLASNDTEAPP